MKKILLFFFISSASLLNAHAQFFDALLNPKVSVTITHPSRLNFKVTKVAFGHATGNCADQIISAITSDFVFNKVVVTDREQLSALLAEQHLSLSGIVDKQTAGPLGKILGATTLIFLDVQRCDTKQEPSYAMEKITNPDKSSYIAKAFYSKTRFDLKASIKAVDLATGVVKNQESMTYAPERINKSFQGQPVYPEPADVQEDGFRMMVQQVHQMFLPWTETKELIFYDDKDGNLKQAFQALKANDIDQALELSKQNLETSKNLPKKSDKTLGHAYYNLAMAYMLHNDYDQALLNFRESSKYRPGDIVNGAIADCQKALAFAATINQIDQNAASAEAKKNEENNAAAQQELANTLTNQDVIKLSQQKLPESLIIQKIKISKCKFNTNSDALVSLNKAGVSEKVIMVMMEKQ